MVNAQYFIDAFHQKEQEVSGLTPLVISPWEPQPAPLPYEEFLRALPKEGLLPTFNYGFGSHGTALAFGAWDTPFAQEVGQALQAGKMAAMEYFRDNCFARTGAGGAERLPAVPVIFGIDGSANGQGGPFRHFDLVFGDKVWCPGKKNWYAFDQRQIAVHGGTARLIAAGTVAHLLRSRLGLDATVKNGVLRVRGLPDVMDREFAGPTAKINAWLKERNLPLSSRYFRQVAAFAVRDPQRPLPNAAVFRKTTQTKLLKHLVDLRGLPRIHQPPTPSPSDGLRVVREAALRRAAKGGTFSQNAVLRDALATDGGRIGPAAVISGHRELFSVPQAFGVTEDRPGRFRAAAKKSFERTMEAAKDLFHRAKLHFTPADRVVHFDTVKDALRAYSGCSRGRSHYEALKAFTASGTLDDRLRAAEHGYRRARTPTMALRSRDTVVVDHALEATGRDVERLATVAARAGAKLILTDTESRIREMERNQTQSHRYQR